MNSYRFFSFPESGAVDRRGRFLCWLVHAKVQVGFLSSRRFCFPGSGAVDQGTRAEGGRARSQRQGEAGTPGALSDCPFYSCVLRDQAFGQKGLGGCN